MDSKIFVAGRGSVQAGIPLPRVGTRQNEKCRVDIAPRIHLIILSISVETLHDGYFLATYSLLVIRYLKVEPI